MKMLPTLNYEGFNLLLLEEVKALLQAHAITATVALRMSETECLEKIQKHGTDRGGFSGNRMWPYNAETGLLLRHDEVVIATIEEDIRRGEIDADYSHSFKKIAIIDSPVLLIYDLSCLEPVYLKQYTLKSGKHWQDALLAIIPINKLTRIEGWFEEQEGLWYRQAVSKIKRGKIAEIGVWQGRSLSFIGSVCQQNQNQLYAIDHWSGSDDQYNDAYRNQLETRDIKNIFRKNMSTRGIPVECVDHPSQHAAQQFAQQSLDMVFLDGSHDYASVKQDIMLWFPLVRHGGTLAGHDFKEKHQGLIQAVTECGKIFNVNIQRGPGSIWYFIKNG